MAEMNTKQESREQKHDVEFQKTVHPDGSYVEIITDQRNKHGEIREYDVQGNCVNTTYFRFS